MKSSTAWLLTLPIAAGVGALVALSLGPRRDASADPAPATLPAESDRELVARIDALVNENLELRERLAVLETRPEPAARTAVGDYVELAEFEAFREQVLEALAGVDSQALQPQTFDKKVADALTAIRKEEQFEKVRKSQEQRTKRLDDDVEKVTEWLELDTRQASRMRSALLAQYDREDEVRRLWEEGADDELLGDRKRESGELFRQDLDSFLSVEQSEQFWERVGGGK